MLPLVPLRCSPAPTLLLAIQIFLVLLPPPRAALLLIQTGPPLLVKPPVKVLAPLR